MTREEVKELLPVMQAFAEGKTIEYSNQDKQWFKTDYPIWENNCKYRIKPEPKYKPFDTKEECWNEMLKHQPFGYLTDKEENNIIIITELFTSSISNRLYFHLSHSSQNIESKDLFNSFNFVDGTPFGIKDY